MKGTPGGRTARLERTLMTVVFLLGCAPGPGAAPATVSPARVETFPLRSSLFANERTIRVWLPPGYDDISSARRRYPVLYMNDGFAVFSAKSWNATESMERLVSSGDIPPMILVGIDNGATATPGSVAQRTREYIPYSDPENDPDTSRPLGDRYPSFLTDEVMPAVARRFRVRTDEGGVGVGGSSYGGVAALYTVLKRPGKFGCLIVESTPTFLGHDALIREAQAARRWPKRVFIGVGTSESADPAMNARVVPAASLLEQIVRRTSPATEVRLMIDEGGEHNGKSWGRRFPEAVKFLWGR